MMATAWKSPDPYSVSVKVANDQDDWYEYLQGSDLTDYELQLAALWRLYLNGDQDGYFAQTRTRSAKRGR